MERGGREEEWKGEEKRGEERGIVKVKVKVKIER